MAYTTKTATLVDDPIALVLIRGGDDFTAPLQDSTFWNPASNDNEGFGVASHDVAFWTCFASTNAAPYTTLQAVDIYGLHEGSFSRYTGGVIDTQNGVSCALYNNGVVRVIDLQDSFTAVASIYTVRYKNYTVGDFSSGDQTLTVGAFSTHSIDFANGAVDQFRYYNGGVILKDTSAANVKAGLFVQATFTTPSALDTRVFLVQSDNSGITLKNAFQFTEGEGPGIFSEGFYASGYDDDFHYTLFMPASDTGPQLAIWNPTTYPGACSSTIYNTAFDDTLLNELWAAPAGNTSTIVATKFGFIITWTYYETFICDPILVSLDWSTYRHITLSSEDAGVQGLIDDTVSGDIGGGLTADANGCAYFCDADSSRGTLYGYTAGAFSATPSDGGESEGQPVIQVWTATIDGHDFYFLNLGTADTPETLVYDTHAEEWYNWGTGTSRLWRAHTGCNWIGGRGLVPTWSDVVVGDDTNGAIYFLSPDDDYDDDATDGAATPRTFTREATGQVVVKPGYKAVPCFGVHLFGSIGSGPADGLTVMLETSDDRGFTYDSQGSVTLDAADYTARADWLSLGSMVAPGRLFRVTDTGALKRVDGLEMPR